MPAGVDVGAARVVAATDEGTTGAENAALAVERSDYVEDFLEGAETPSVAVEGQVYALGDAAPEVATIVNDEPTRLLGADSSLPSSVVPEAAAELLGHLVGDGEGPLRYVPPSRVDAAPLSAAAEALGYEPGPIDAGIAVLYDALEPPYTGLGVVVDGTRTLATLAVAGVPVARTELDRGGDWIDSELADATGNDPDAVAELRANASLEDPSSGALALRYDTLLSNLAIAVAEDSVPLAESIPVVIAGAAAPDGIDVRFEDALEDVELPFPVESVARADDPEEAAARGALVAAQAGGAVSTDLDAPAADAPGYAAELADRDAASDAVVDGLAAAAEAASVDDEVAGDAASGTASTAGTSSGAGTADGGGVIAGEVAGRGPLADALGEFAGVGDRVDELAARLEETAPAETVEAVEEVAEAAADALEAAEDALDVAENAEAKASDAEAAAEEVATTAEAVEDDVGSLGDDVGSLEDDVGSIEGALDSLAADLEAVESRLEALPPIADLVDLAERVDALEPEDVESIGDGLAELRDRVDELAEEVADGGAGADAEAVEAVGAIEARLEGLREDLDGVEATLEDLQADVEERLEGAADADTVDALRERLDVVETTAEDAEVAARDLDAAVTEVTDAVDGVESTVDGVESSVAEVESSVAEVESTVEAVESSIADVEASVEAVEADLEEAQEGGLEPAELDALADRVGEAEDRLADVEGEAADPDLVDALSVDLEALRGRVEELEDAVDERVGGIDDRLDEIESGDAEEIGGLQGDVAGLETEVDDLAERLGEVAGDLSGLREEHDGAVDDLEEALEDLRSEVRAIPTDTVDRNHHQTAIGTVEDRLDALEASSDAGGGDGGAGALPIVVLGVGLLGVGGLGAALAFLGGEVELAGAFVGVPVLATVLAWYLS